MTANPTPADARSYLADVFNAMGRVRAQHKETGAYHGEVECPACGKALQWSMASRHKHTRGWCATRECVAWME